MKTVSSLLLLFSLAMAGCTIINPAENLPGYIYIDEIDFEGVYTNSHNISDIWVYNQEKLIGIFELPASIPVLDKGVSEFTFRAGIKRDGIANNRQVYPFYTKFTQEINIQELKIDTVFPHFEFKENVVFPSGMQEQFELLFNNFSPFGSSDTSMVVTSDPTEIYPHYGSLRSGKVVIPENGVLWQEESGLDPLPSGKDIWVEFDFKTNNTFAVGLRPFVGGSPESLEQVRILKNTKDENGIPQWKKVYVQLSNAAGSNPSAENFRLYFQALKDPNNTNPVLYFDNIKVVHFN